MALEVDVEALIAERGDALHPPEDLDGAGIETGAGLLPLPADAVDGVREHGCVGRSGHGVRIAAIYFIGKILLKFLG